MATKITNSAGKVIGATVQSGDTLSSIASTYKSYISGSTNSARISTLKTVNDITDVNRIYIGEKIYFTADGASSAGSTTKKKSSKCAIVNRFGLQSDSDNTLFATWTWTKKDSKGNSTTENYEVRWYYATGDGVWFVGNDGTTEYKQSTYSIPSNATKVKFKVKPIAKKSDKTGKVKWKAEWSTEKIYNVSDNPPGTPSTPTVEIDENDVLIASLDNISDDLNAKQIEFEVYKNDKYRVIKGEKITIKFGSVTYKSKKLDKGAEYKVRCRSVRGDQYSDWSDYSDNYHTSLVAPSGITSLKRVRSDGKLMVYLKWGKVKTATAYEIEYTTDKTWFDNSNVSIPTATTKDNTNSYYLDFSSAEGDEYFFRVRATSDDAEPSDWTEIRSLTVGDDPGSPTTWSSTTKVESGDPLKLYWVHNSSDGSSQTFATLWIKVVTADGTTHDAHMLRIPNPYAGNAEREDETSVFEINTAGGAAYSYTYDGTTTTGLDLSGGATITWKVATAGALTIIVDGVESPNYGPWSTPRTVEVFAPIVIGSDILDSDDIDDGTQVEKLTKFPFYLHLSSQGIAHKPIGLHVSIVSNTAYDTMDTTGERKWISAGDEVYGKYFDGEWIKMDDDEGYRTIIEFSAGNIDLENNASYDIYSTITMDNGLSSEGWSASFKVRWSDEDYDPNAEFFYNEEGLSMHINPYCRDDETDELISDVLLSVYRLDYEGKLVEIATNIENDGKTFITDPHPSLMYPTYRIVAVSQTTGGVSYSDLPGEDIDEPAIVIQWNEDWGDLVIESEAELEQRGWTGSLLKLGYNVDISDKYNPDVTFVEYIGRDHPVSYYGTQRGVSASWKVEIPKSDHGLLYGLRELAAWMGDVYVREPSGSGYWAHVNVSFSQTHCALTIPVTIDVTRVEGGA